MNNYNILVFFLLVYLFISFSILGYGLLVERLHKKNLGEELGFTGLVGIFVLIIYSYISHIL